MTAPTDMSASAGATELRNVAIVAHVDHGKTTLVDSMLRQTGVFGSRAGALDKVPDRVLDSNDQERERGITIFAKQASVRWGHYKLNIVDTPGHADFGGEVERGLHIVDGVLLLVDAAEGPLPQTRYVLSKALAKNLPVVVVINKVDRQDARADEVLAEIEQLFFDLLGEHGDASHLEFPVISAIARDGRAVSGIGMPGDGDDLTALFEAIVKTIPAPTGDPSAPLQAIVNNLDASDYLGRLAIGRVQQGTLRKGELTAVCGAEPAEGVPGGIVKRKLGTLLGVDGLTRVDVDEVSAGDLFVVAGFPEIEIGDTLADAAAPVALDRLAVDEPVLSMTFGVNTAPTAGREGKYLTSRHLRERLDREILGNVSIRLRNTDSPDVIEVAGRGELQLAVLIETMRREGYELQVSRPEVITKMVDGARHEPFEEVTVDVPEEHVGTVTQSIAPRKGQLTDMRPGDAGRTILRFDCPSRGLLGLRGELLTQTRGTALIHQRHAGFVPWVGDLPQRLGGAMVADRAGVGTGYALDNLQSRGTFFIDPGEEVYEGMVVGENARNEEMLVNVTKEKAKTNIRTHSHDDAVKLPPKREMTLEAAIEFIEADELVEVTPKNVRVRKRLLKEEDRRRTRR
jgi:GTP-binding protein